jgi:hypothetical protein
MYNKEIIGKPESIIAQRNKQIVWVQEFKKFKASKKYTTLKCRYGNKTKQAKVRSNAANRKTDKFMARCWI